MKDQFAFQIFTPITFGNLHLQLDSLLMQLDMWMYEHLLSQDSLLQSRIYLTDAVNQIDAVKSSALYTDLLNKGAVSYIEQPLLNGAKVAVQVWFANSPAVKKTGNDQCLKVEVDGLRLLFQSVRFTKSEVEGLDSKAQTELAFAKHIQVLEQNGMNLRQNCHRTWIYVRDIDRNYAGVVEGRNEVFATQGLTKDTHYISSTGIGGNSADKEALVAVDFFSVDGLPEEYIQYLHALEYLNPTHQYGVAFERGTKLTFGDSQFFTISGTASIDKTGTCVHRGDVMTQAGRLFLNIDKLLNDGGASLSDIKYMIVYLRDVSDAQAIEKYVSLRFPTIPHLVTLARVCRPEWLIEVECIAMK